MRKIRFEQWVLLLVVVVGAVTTSVIGLSTLHQSHEGAVAKQALCALKLDLVRRVDSSEQFLRDHPDGIPGIPVAVIRSSITNQQATLRSLALLHCPTTRKETS